MSFTKLDKVSAQDKYQHRQVIKKAELVFRLCSLITRKCFVQEHLRVHVLMFAPAVLRETRILTQTNETRPSEFVNVGMFIYVFFIFFYGRCRLNSAVAQGYYYIKFVWVPAAAFVVLITAFQ